MFQKKSVVQNIFILLKHLSFKVWHNNSIIISLWPSEAEWEQAKVDWLCLVSWGAVWCWSLLPSLYCSHLTGCPCCLATAQQIVKLSCLWWCKFQAGYIHIYSGHWVILFKHKKRILQEENQSWCSKSIWKDNLHIQSK